MYSKIKKLPQHIIGRISAGEVVERPVNIVKELVENSIDADATNIQIIIENGGLDRVYVQDNGSGIPERDLHIAFELHTTSKLFDTNISKVSTLGFRGEALASIAAVSRVECKSRIEDEDENTGNQIIIEGGKLISSKSILMNKGTSVQISGIFYNTPARRKFLKKPTTERKRIIDLITHYSLSYPEIHFLLEEKEKNKLKKRLESPSRKSVLSVIYDVLGHEIAGELVPIKGKINIWNLEGYISNPNLTRSDRSYQYLCINGRAVRHPELQNAIESAFGSQLMRSAHPIIILNISGPIDAVDFNIHPQKSEVRFYSDDPIITDIGKLIQNSLVESAELPVLHETKLKRISQQHKTSTTQQIGSKQQNKQIIDGDENQIGLEKLVSASLYQQQSLNNEKAVYTNGIKVLGHIMLKFAVIDGGNNELWLVDIHAADERIKFEKFEASAARKALSQEFLQPLLIEFLPSEKQLLLDNIDVLEKFGLIISHAPGSQLFIHSCPVYFDQEISSETTKKLLEEIASFLDDDSKDEFSTDSPFSRIEYGIVSRLACHGSIRSGVPVSKQTISNVVRDLQKCKSPWVCAHGRPTVLRITRSRLEGWFKR